MTSAGDLPEGIESCFRVISTVAAAHPERRDLIFDQQAADAVRYARLLGVDKILVVDRLEAIAAGFDWTVDERQRRITEAIARANPPADDIAGGKIYHAAEQATDSAPMLGVADDADARPPEFSDDALAHLFAERHTETRRYVAAFGKWYEYDCVCWRVDNTLHTFDLVRRICREVAAACQKPKIAAAISSGKTISAAEKLARSDRRLAATADQWDVDLWLLNTPAGVVDLRTGEIRPHRADDYITKVTGAAPDASCQIPIWRKFLDRITGNDADLISFMKRMSGYALTGSTREHGLFFCFGTGANGKTTFLSALTGCMGDYHRTSAIETFTASTTERHPTDLAGLRGARLVTAVETEEGRRWAESKIKSLTGGDRIAARFMRQDFFEFAPQFKLIVAGNHKPGLRSVDEAIRRRFHLLPFVITIPLDERDETLSDQLTAEWPGILAWAIEGCLEWQECGLAPPAAVQAATAAYLEAEDALAAWIEEVGEIDPASWESSIALYRSWKAWADRAGEYVGSLKKFSQRLEDRSAAIGMHKSRDAQGRRGFQGLRVTKPDLGGGAVEVAP